MSRRVMRAEPSEGQGTKRGQGPSFGMADKKGAKESSAERVFPRETPESPPLSKHSSVDEGPFSPSQSSASSAPGAPRADYEPWAAPGAPMPQQTSGGTYKVPEGQSAMEEDADFFVLDSFIIDHKRALEYAEKVNEEMAAGKPYPMSKQQKVYEKFIVPYQSCVFWKKYKYTNVYLGGGSFGLVLQFTYNGKNLAVKFEAYKSGDDTKYKDMVNEIAMNALINQLPDHHRFGVVKMFDWARCHFKFSDAIGFYEAAILAEKKPIVNEAHTWQMIVFENVGATLRQTFGQVRGQNNEKRTYEFWSAAYLQVVITQLYLWRNIEFRHLDLHWNNILTKAEPDPNKTHILYSLKDVKGQDVSYRVPLANTNNLLMMISDMGQAASGRVQVIQDKYFENPKNLTSQTQLDLLYMENIWARVGDFDRILDSDIKIATKSSEATLASVKQEVGGYDSPGIGYIDFEKLITGTPAFEQYKTDQGQPLQTDRVMYVNNLEHVRFTRIEASRSRK